MIRKVVGIYYSPVGGTEIMTEALARKVGAILDDNSPLDVSVECYDMPAAEAMKRFAGNGAMTLAAVSYGGRKYGNALFELKRLAEDCGFKAIGAGAFMISYMALRGSSRGSAPVIDLESLYDFGKAASEKIGRLSGSEIAEFRIKPVPVEVNGRMPVHMISRVSPKAAALAQEVFNKLSVLRRKSEWFL